MSRCTLCPLHKAVTHVKIDGVGSTTAKYFFVTDRPEGDGHEPCSGRDRETMFSLLSEAGIPAGEVFISYAVRCFTGRTKGKINDAGITVARKCRPHLQEELDFIKPEVIFTMGAAATKAVLGNNNIKFEELRGSFIGKVFPIYNLRQLYYDPALKATMVADIKRAINPSILVGHDWGSGVKIQPTLEELDTALAEAKRVGCVASDVETTGLDWFSPTFQVTHYGAYWGDNRGVVFDPRQHPDYYQKFLELKQWVHNAAYEGNIYPAGTIEHDSLALMYLTDPNLAQKSLGLEPLSRQFLGVETWKGKESDWMSWAKRNAFDVRCTWELVHYALERLNPQQLRLYSEIILPTASILGGLRARKIYIDKTYQKKMVRLLKEEMAKIKEELEWSYSFSGNPNSSAQCKEFLYKTRGIKMLRRGGEDNESTDANVLAELALNYPEADLIRAYRKLKKVESNYVYTEEFIRPDIRYCGTVSGRTSGKDGIQTHPRPNQKYLPGIVVRSLFLPERGQWVGGDLAQGELVTAAIKSQDPVMLELYKRVPRGDIHTETAVSVFGNASKENRYKAKPINFLMLYGGKAGMLRMTALKEYGVLFTYPEAAEYRMRFFMRYEGLQKWHLECGRHAMQYGYVDSPMGQRYPIPGIHSKDPRKVEEAIRYAINWPNQGDVHYLTMLGLKAAHALDPQAPVLPVHDFIGCASENAEEFKAEWEKLWLKNIQEYYPTDVPIGVDMKVGRTLADV